MTFRTVAVSARARILAWYVVLLALALAISVITVRQVLIDHINHRIDAELHESAAELGSLALSHPADEKTTSLADLLRAGVRSGVPEQNATLIGLMDGRPFARAPQPVPVRLDLIPNLVTRWAAARHTQFGVVETSAGQVRYAAVPVPGYPGRGVLISAIFSSRDLAEANDVTRVLVESMAIALLLASILAWFAAGRVLAPVRNVTELARSITESDLTARIPVRGNDEISELARTFNRMLDRLDEAFTAQRAFIDDAGHELRTPITIIRGHLELMGEDPIERAEAMGIVTDELDRMSRQVDDLLTLAKATQPAFLHLDTADIANLTDEVFIKAQALGPRRWELDGHARGRAVMDRQRITQALVQLATNAVQHTQTDDRISVGSATANGDVRFWVSDSGEGIDHADQARIFERFSRANGRPGGSGAGLGLAIVHSIAAAHHGSVDVSSAPGRGSTFTLTIPMDQPLSDEPGDQR